MRNYNRTESDCGEMCKSFTHSFSVVSFLDGTRPCRSIFDHISTTARLLYNVYMYAYILYTHTHIYVLLCDLDKTFSRLYCVYKIKMKGNAIDKIVLNTSSMHFVNRDSVRFVFINIVNRCIHVYVYIYKSIAVTNLCITIIVEIRF